MNWWNNFLKECKSIRFQEKKFLLLEIEENEAKEYCIVDEASLSKSVLNFIKEFEPDYTEDGGQCREDCLKMLEGRLGHYRNVKELPFPTTEDDEDDPPNPFVLKGRIVAHPEVNDEWMCEYVKQYACLGQVPGPAAEAFPAAKRPRPR